ncbi:alpha/beta hydrolase [Streptomyces anulatus]|uniref:alpha/beta hydrolase n=1 Tax=Streptomyces anulatus TaxID=1892 RepID=UPI0036CF1799
MHDAPHIREVVLSGGGIPLSGLLAEPPDGLPPRALVVAVHGGGMRAGYFHGLAHPGQSLLELGARLGLAVLAVDRPGYGLSAARLPEGQTLAEQSVTLRAAIEGFAASYAPGAGIFILAHSYGGKLALSVAAGPQGLDLLGLDISGCGHRYAADAGGMAQTTGRGMWKLNWGVLSLYPPDSFRRSRSLVAPVPPRESAEARTWPERFPAIAARVRVPVRFTFAEHEHWWLRDEAAIATLTTSLGSARVVVDHLPRAGHNISLGWAARSYHLRALAFLEECLMEREPTLPDGSAGQLQDEVLTRH